MKPIQKHKDPRITNITFDKFIEFIGIVTSITDDEDRKQFMLSPPQTNGTGNLFNSNHHLSLITQPVLGARSRKQTKIDPITNNRRSSSDDLPAIILPINRVDKSQHEKKSNHHESSDSGIDLSLSTNSSLQYPQQQHLIIHRPLSALNEDLNTTDGNHEHSFRIPVIHPGRNRSIETTISNNIHEQQHPQNSFFDEREKINHNGVHLDTLKELHQQTNMNKNEFLRPPTQQHRSLNDLTNKPLLTIHTITRKPNISPLRKKSKLNIIIEQSIPLSSPRLVINDDPIHSGTRTTSSSSNQTISHSIQTINKKTKPKAITPLGHYPNQEQIRAHINRSVIERQYPYYITVLPPKRGLIQQMVPFDAAPSKVNNLLLKQQKQSTTTFHPNPGGLGVSTTQNFHTALSRPTKHTLPILYNDEIIDDHQEQRNQKNKRRFNEITKYPKSSQKEQVPIEDIQDRLKFLRKHENSRAQLEPTIVQHHLIVSNKRQQEKEISFDKKQKKRIEEDQIENFLTSTPRRYYEIDNHHNKNPQQQIVNNFHHTSTDDKLKHNQSNSTTISRINTSNLKRQQQSTRPTYGSKPAGNISRNKNQPMNSNTELESEYFRRDTIVPFQSRPTKQICIPKIQCPPEQNHQFKQRKKSPDGSINNLLRTTGIQPTNTNNIRRRRDRNRPTNTSKTSATRPNKIQKKSNGVFQPRSPTSWSIISDHQINQQQYDPYESSSSSASLRHELTNSKSNRTYELFITNEQQPLHRTYVISTDNNSQLPPLINPPSPTSSHHTYPFTCTTASDNINDAMIDNSSRELSALNAVDDQHSLSSSSDRLSPTNRVPLPSGKVAISMEDDDISTNYDSDDGWSDDSAEVLYIDERYITQKKKIISSSSQQHSHLQTQQQNILLQ